MHAHEINAVSSQLSQMLDFALRRSVREVVIKCNLLGNVPEEPDFIASLVLNFSKDLFIALTTLFPKKKFSVTGIYCHQRPIVDIGESKDPELGDILFVYIYKDAFGNKQFNSLLFQAKRTQNIVTHVAPGDMHQLKLYTHWPKFQYKRAGELNKIFRDILPKTINDGAQYLLIDDHPVSGLSGLPNTFPMGCAIPDLNLRLDSDFGNEIIKFLKFKSGRTFEESPLTTTDDWTKMIWELLKIAKTKASKRKNIGISSFPRRHTHSSDGLCFFNFQMNSIFSDLHLLLKGSSGNDGYDQFVDEENVGVSIILIESSVGDAESPLQFNK